MMAHPIHSGFLLLDSDLILVSVDHSLLIIL